VRAPDASLDRLASGASPLNVVGTLQDYVYHCHIVEHEDNDIMRPFTVMP
jgi:hypothetical protein